jgi:hypothetical protein
MMGREPLQEKTTNTTPLVVPPAVRRKAYFKSGQELGFKASGRLITIMPKVPQRPAIDAEH